ncbi:MAG: hypothetical protein V2A71_01295 [Candidatus Eisenbacteria bacterium]
MTDHAKGHERIKVYVNSKPILISPALSVRHAILAYDEDALADITAGQAYVADARGAEVGLEGALFDGMTLYVQSAETE